MTTTLRSPSHDRGATAHGAVVVGVDGLERNHAAVVWARQEAEDTGRKLVLVSADEGYITSLPRFAAGPAGRAADRPTGRRRAHIMASRSQRERVTGVVDMRRRRC